MMVNLICKQELRSRIRKIRRSTTKQSIQQASENIVKRLFSTKQWQNAKTVGIYASTAGEVATRSIFEQAWLERKQCGAPILTERSVLSYQVVSQWLDFQRGHWGILEPRKTCPILVSKDIELLILPCFAVDEKGNRLGGGMGLFDRYLATSPETTYRVCLAFSWQYFATVPHNERDQPIHTILTEDGQFFPTIL